MTHSEFVYNSLHPEGQHLCDPGGKYCGECVSYWKSYCSEVFGIDPAELYVPDDAAKNIWYMTTTSMLKHFDRITSDPQIGDTIVYDGYYGDVAIYNGNGAVVGQLGTPVFEPVAKRPIGNYIGILRHKGESMHPTENQVKDYDKAFRQPIGKAPYTQAEINARVNGSLIDFMYEIPLGLLDYIVTHQGTADFVPVTETLYRKKV